MTAPRQVLRGTTYLVTRRCAHRQFLLNPSKVTNETFLYVLAIAARRFEIHVHAFCVLSNHFHMIVTDPHARLPAFHQYLDALVARALNAALGRWESFWAPNSYSAVTLVSPSDIVDKAAYVLANPVAAGLVRSGRLWPGLWSALDQIDGEALEASRPKHFFDPDGPLPDRIRLPRRARDRARRPGSPCAREAPAVPRRRPRPRPETDAAAEDRRAAARPEPAHRVAGQVEADRGARAARRVPLRLPGSLGGAPRRGTRDDVPV